MYVCVYFFLASIFPCFYVYYEDNREGGLQVRKYRISSLHVLYQSQQKFLNSVNRAAAGYYSLDLLRLLLYMGGISVSRHIVVITIWHLHNLQYS